MSLALPHDPQAGVPTRPTLLFACALLLLPYGPAFASVHGSITVSFEGTSTLHSFTGTLPAVTFDARATPVSPGEKQTWDADVEVPVATMTTDNDRRDRNMREMFEADRFPHIKAAIRGIDPDQLRLNGAGGDAARRSLLFDLTIRNVTYPLVARVSNWQEGADHASFDVDFDLSLKRFDLKAPTALLFIRVGDRVAVHAAVSIRRE